MYAFCCNSNEILAHGNWSIGNVHFLCFDLPLETFITHVCLPHDQELQLGRNVKKRRLNTKRISVFASPQLVPTRCHNVYFSNPSYIVNNKNNSQFGNLCIALINN